MKKILALLPFLLFVLLVIMFMLVSSQDAFKKKKKAVGEKAETEAVEKDVPADDDVSGNTHLKFKGVPIDGTLKKFVDRMERKGFEVEGMEDGKAVLSGDFADFKSCMVYVATLENKDLVSFISVAFPKREQWSGLYGDYKHLKEMLTEKYGKPSECVEKFQFLYGGPHDDGEKIHAVEFDRCNYMTRFVVDEGSITLSIEHQEVSDCFVVLSYRDKENGNIVRNHAIDDL